MSDSDEFVGRIIKLQGGPPGPNASIWLNMPMLGDMPGQSYYGRVVVEIWDQGEFATHTAYPHEPRKTAYLLKHAILALQSNDTPILTTTPWSDDKPALEPGLPGQTFRGRVAVEVWDSQATVAITGSGQLSDLAGRAVQELLQIVRIADLPSSVKQPPFSPASSV